MKVAVLCVNDFPSRVFQGDLSTVEAFAAWTNAKARKVEGEADEAGKDRPPFRYHHVHLLDLEQASILV